MGLVPQFVQISIDLEQKPLIEEKKTNTYLFNQYIGPIRVSTISQASKLR